MTQERPAVQQGASGVEGTAPAVQPGAWTVWGARWIVLLVFAGSALAYGVISARWHMAVDTPVMHYVVLLMRHGLRPYADITDNNMPGTYLAEATAMRVFGASDLGWRLYEFFLLALLGAAAAWIARSRDWVAGIFAAGVFVVLHSAEGPQLAVERELVIAVLLMVACALMCEAVDRSKAFWMFPFGLCCGVAAGIKPTYLPLSLVLLIPAMVRLRRAGQQVRGYVLWSLVGLLVVGAVLIGFLVMNHALQPFAFVVLQVVPAYAGIQHLGLGALLFGLLPRAVLALTVLSVPLFLRSFLRRDWSWRQTALTIAAGFGLLSYLLQGKGYVYHRYVFIVFLLLLIGLETFPALRSTGWPRWLAFLILLLAVSVVPGHLRSAAAIPAQTSFETTLEQDLRGLGGSQLSGHVQCFDLVYGCLDALYHLDLVDPAGFTGDMLFFSPVATPPVLFYRDRFWEFARKDPAEVLVVSNGVFAEPNSYGKLARWPEFAHYLQAQYVLVVERNFPHELYTYKVSEPVTDNETDSYRLYVRRANPRLVQQGLALAARPEAAVR